MRPTLSDVAKMAGVSVATASRALSNPDLVADSTRRAVRDAAASCGYKVNLVARSLRIQRTNTLLVLQPCIDNSFYPALLRSIEDTALAFGYSVPRPEVPVVQVLDAIYGSAVPSVGVDDEQVAEIAVRHLASLGHRRIAHISGATGCLTSEQRQKGYMAAMARLGLPADGELVRSGSGRRDGAAEAMKQLLALPNRPTAVFCATDTMACAAMDVCRDRGIHVPGDISFVGADNTADGQFAFPALTTVHVPRIEIGAKAVERLIGLIRGQAGMAQDMVLPVELRLRGSCAPMRAAVAA